MVFIIFTVLYPLFYIYCICIRIGVFRMLKNRFSVRKYCGVKVDREDCFEYPQNDQLHPKMVKKRRKKTAGEQNALEKLLFRNTKRYGNAAQDLIPGLPV